MREKEKNVRGHTGEEREREKYEGAHKDRPVLHNSP